MRVKSIPQNFIVRHVHSHLKVLLYFCQPLFSCRKTIILHCVYKAYKHAISTRCTYAKGAATQAC